MNLAIKNSASAATTSCYHCGEAVPKGSQFFATLSGIEQPMCCPGCVAVAQMIDAGGLGRFYDQRTAYNIRPDEMVLEQADQLRIYDEPALAQTFSHALEDGTTEVQVLLSGVSCAACTWLIENAIGRLEGVERALVNLQDSRLDVRLNLQQCRISDVFIHLQRLGYEPRPYEANLRREQLQAQQRESLKRLAVAGLGMMQVGMFAIALHAGDLQGIADEYKSLLRWVSLPVAAVVVFYSARGFFSNAWRHLRYGALVMDLPIAIAIGLAFSASVWATAMQTGQVYFDSVVMFTFFLLLGRHLEQGARQRYLRNWSDTQNSLPAAVTTRQNGQWALVPRPQLAAGDTILVKSGEVVAADATVIRGTGELREDAFTGESLPRRVKEGDTIYAGTININQELEACVSCDYQDSRLALLLRSVHTAQASKPRLATLADRIAGWFVGGVLLVAATTFISWLVIDSSQALWVTLSVLVISCPCALALATPAALTAAASALRERGVIVNAENALEALASVTHMVFDKTGTLTQGNLQIEATESLGRLGKPEILSLAAALQKHANHPVAKAFEHVATSQSLDDVKVVQGAGIETRLHGKTLRIGSEQFCRQIAPELVAPPTKPLYWVALCQQDEPLAWIGFSDTLRSESSTVIDTVKKRGVQIELLTGDSSAQASQIARALNIEHLFAGVTPQEKLEHVQSLQATGAVVCMVGDGLNDAPVLGVADVSFAVASATELARAQAALVIADGDLHKVTEAQDIARRCYRIMRQNIGWALAYNVSAIPLAAMGMVPPWAAALGMSASSLLVVLNALRLTR